MEASVIISMIVVLGFYWGLTLYFVRLALQKEKEKARAQSS
ncbi:hypothetical protein OCC_13470 [Thermococcus litoralis DSM 5473]|jgi:hypothetical protein|uniref:MetS family NSS transporter small subunit n=1 Tax=Thermococcus litoralis (strain ATCC 51850 / DSM 5473 / JCM 8560 / NS-C) TaxID=523849 RepID=S5ZTK7_THELN|nr:hypothetical protein [Thermococcus litoralis]AGT34189.1 hypothetical protein OCC_13470 [Thermococcus litoralis DSM 5473]